jgi:hypothetical protein
MRSSGPISCTDQILKGLTTRRVKRFRRRSASSCKAGK